MSNTIHFIEAFQVIDLFKPSEVLISYIPAAENVNTLNLLHENRIFFKTYHLYVLTGLTFSKVNKMQKNYESNPLFTLETQKR